MDNLFGEDLQDAQGRLLNVKWGVKGMDMVVKYFIEVAVSDSNYVWSEVHFIPCYELYI